jgi:hypothetical protein
MKCNFSSRARGLVLLFVIVAGLLGLGYILLPHITTRWLHQDVIIAADLWSHQPAMLSAGYGFDGIIGVSGGEAEVRAAGGTWNTATCTNGERPERAILTSSAQPYQVAIVYGRQVAFADGLPVVFSWPILPGTLDPSDFRVTLNTGEIVVPEAASIYPNSEYNERHVAVLFADFGNRLLPGQPGARYVTRVEVVADTTPLMLVGPAGLVTAVGLFKDSTTSPYQSGPFLVGAKLNRLSNEDEGAPAFLSGTLPNDGVALYGANAAYRLRVLTSGGFSPDGVRGVLPIEFARFFRIHAQTASGEPVLITQTDQDYQVDGGVIRVLGLAELGLAQSANADGTPRVAYDACYREDHDNYIDIILQGDEQAMRQITFVEIPAAGAYDPFYNPGGPGNNPTPGVRYTAAGPPDLEPVIIALDDLMVVTYGE